MPDTAALITVLILERALCLACVAIRANVSETQVEALLARIAPVVLLHAEFGERCWACGRTGTVVSMIRPGGGLHEPMSHPATPRLDGLQILVVDDDHDSLDVLGHVFMPLGAAVEAVDNAWDALAWLEHKRADVIVSDLSMPDGDGLDLIRHLRALPREVSRPTPAIALSAYAREEDRQRALASGYQVFLTKPTDPYEIAAEIRRLVHRSG